jgi:hypothetical protein
MMTTPEAGQPNGFRRGLVIVGASVTTTLVVTSIATAILVWSDQRMLKKDMDATHELIASNQTLISACCAEGGKTRGDLRNLTTRFDAFLSNLEALLKASEKRLQRLEDKRQ